MIKLSYKRLALFVLPVLMIFIMGNVSLQTTTIQPIQEASVTQIFSIGQFGVLLYLIVRRDAQIADQQKAWREERKWLIGMLFQANTGTKKREDLEL